MPPTLDRSTGEVESSIAAPNADKADVPATSSNARLPGTARSDWMLMVFGPLFMACICAWAMAEDLTFQKGLGIAFFAGCMLVGLLRRVHPWLAVIATRTGIDLVLSASARIPFGMADLERARLVMRGETPFCGLRLRDPDAFLARIAPDFERDILRVLVRDSLGPAGIAAGTLADAIRLAEKETGFHFLFAQKQVGGAPAAAAAVLEQCIVKWNWLRATASV